MESFTTITLEEVRERIQNCCKDLGVVIRLGNIKYDSTTFRCTRLEAAIAPKIEKNTEDDPYAVNNAVEVIDKQNWNQHCIYYGFTPEDWGKSVEIRSGRLWGTYTLLSIKTRSRKYPIIVKGRDGRKWKVPKSFINMETLRSN